jgi:hypothetical protein
MVTRNLKALSSGQVEEVQAREKVYKVVRHGTHGKGLYSALAGKFGGEDTKTAKCLEYKVGLVTSDVASGDGIFIYLDKAYALDQAQKMAEKVDGRPMSVYSAKAIGDIVIPAGKSKTATCDALVLIEKVADVKPAPKWQDITRTVSITRSSMGVWYLKDGVATVMGAKYRVSGITLSTIKVEKLI